MIRNQKGFTLVEMMVVVLISSILFYGVYAVMRAGLQQGNALDVKMTIHESGREGLYKMIQEIRLSAPDQITIGAEGNTIQFSIPNPDDGVAADYTIDWDNSQLIQYAIAGDDDIQIIRTNLTTGTETVIANDVDDLLFAGTDEDGDPSDEPTVVTVTIDLQRQTIEGRNMPANAIVVEGQAKIRNL